MTDALPPNERMGIRPAEPGDFLLPCQPHTSHRFPVYRPDFNPDFNPTEFHACRPTLRSRLRRWIDRLLRKDNGND